MPLKNNWIWIWVLQGPRVLYTHSTFDKPWSSSVVSKPGNNATNISRLAPLSTAESPPATLGFQHLPGCYHRSPELSILLTVLLNSIPNCCHCLSALENTSSHSARLPPLPGCAELSSLCLGSDNRCQTAIIISCSTLHPAWALTSTWAATATVTQLKYPLCSPRLWLWDVTPSILIILPWANTSCLHLPRLFPCLIIHPLLSMRAPPCLTPLRFQHWTHWHVEGLDLVVQSLPISMVFCTTPKIFLTIFYPNSFGERKPTWVLYFFSWSLFLLFPPSFLGLLTFGKTHFNIKISHPISL